MIQRNIYSHRSASPDVNYLMAEESKFQKRHSNKDKCQSLPIHVNTEEALINIFTEFTMQSPIELELFGLKSGKGEEGITKPAKSTRPKRVFFDANSECGAQTTNETSSQTFGEVNCQIIDENSVFSRAISVPENNTLPIGAHTHSVALCLMKHFYTNYTQ